MKKLSLILSFLCAVSAHASTQPSLTDMMQQLQQQVTTTAAGQTGSTIASQLKPSDFAAPAATNAAASAAPFFTGKKIALSLTAVGVAALYYYAKTKWFKNYVTEIVISEEAADQQDIEWYDLTITNRTRDITHRIKNEKSFETVANDVAKWIHDNLQGTHTITISGFVKIKGLFGARRIRPITFAYDPTSNQDFYPRFIEPFLRASYKRFSDIPQATRTAMNEFSCSIKTSKRILALTPISETTYQNFYTAFKESVKNRIKPGSQEVLTVALTCKTREQPFHIDPVQIKIEADELLKRVNYDPSHGYDAAGNPLEKTLSYLFQAGTAHADHLRLCQEAAFNLLWEDQIKGHLANTTVLG